VERLAPGAGRRGRKAQRRANLSQRGITERERLLERRTPLLQTVGIDAFEELDIHQTVANLDVGVRGRREQVDLFAVLDRFSGQGRKPWLDRTEVLTEGAPFPARYNLVHRVAPPWRSSSSGVVALVSVVRASC